MEDMALRVLSLNSAGSTVSALAATSFTLRNKYEAVVELVRSHRPHAISLQEIEPSSADSLARSLAGEGYASGAVSGRVKGCDAAPSSRRESCKRPAAAAAAGVPTSRTRPPARAQ